MAINREWGAFDTDEFDEVERYELHEAPAYRFASDRRIFIQTVGAGLVVTVAAHAARGQQASVATPRGESPGVDDDAAERYDRFLLRPDGKVSVLTGKVDVGQGIAAQLVQAVLEECPLGANTLSVIMADTDHTPNDGGTAGSRTTPSTVPRVRSSAARLRELLCQLVAQKWDVPRSAVSLQDGVFIAAGQKKTFAEWMREGLIAEASLPKVPDEVALTPVDEWNALGKSQPNPNGLDVVTGRCQYVSDVRLENMWYGRVLRPPTLNARLSSIEIPDDQSAPDVVVVREGDFVGCAAASSWQARKTVEAVAQGAKWEESPHPSSKTLFEHFKATARDGGSRGSRRRDNRWGDVDAGLEAASKRLEAAYTVAYIQHAPMEPRAAVAKWDDGKLTVWTGTQQPSRVRDELASAFQLAREQVRLITPMIGGGFGGKHSGETAVEAARLAKAAGRPVSLCWTREEEFTWAYCRPAGLIEVRAGLDDAKQLIAWDFTNYNSGGSAIATPYDVPNGQTRFVSCDSPLRQGSYRALASAANTFAREAAMDELAAMAGADPLEFRLQYLREQRLKHVLQAAADKFGWASRTNQRAQKRGVGLACGTEKGSYVAACADVEVVDDTIRVHRICQAFECGAIQNPQNLRAQVEGCMVMGLGGALTEAMEFEQGRILTNNFSSYQVPRMRDLPKLDIVLVNRPDLESVGAGETPIIAVAPAIANAVFAATGIRCRSMPLSVAKG